MFLLPRWGEIQLQCDSGVSRPHSIVIKYNRRRVHDLPIEHQRFESIKCIKNFVKANNRWITLLTNEEVVKALESTVRKWKYVLMMLLS